MKYIKTVDQYLAKSGKFEPALNFLREIVLTTELQETVKWGSPVYTIEGKNVVGLGAFKSYVGIWFWQGVFLSDPKNKLINAQEGVTKALRQWRFSSIKEIEKDSDTIKSYLEEAILNQRQGKEIKPAKKKPLKIPTELKTILVSDASLAKSFEALSLTNKRDFAEYIEVAKRAETKEKRLAKITPMIREGVGLNDKYKK